MSAFVRFEPKELAWEDLRGQNYRWVVMGASWPVPASAIRMISFNQTQGPNGEQGYRMEIASMGPGETDEYLWLGTKDALWDRLNGLGPVGLDAARLSSVLQRLLVELDLEGAKPVALAPVVAAAKAQAQARMDLAAGLSLEQAIAAGHAVLERDGVHTHLTWVRGDNERTADLNPMWLDAPWAGDVMARLVWPLLDRATVQHEEPEVWERAVSAWARRPEWPVEQAGEGAA